MKNRRTGLIMLGWAMILLTLVSGCVSTNSKFAALRHDYQVKQTFEDFIVPQGYNFYYFGRESIPDAFVGISKKFVLESSLWQPVELTSEILQEWIWVRANRLKGDPRNFGSNIVGPNMEHIGIWYSLESWQQWARIELVDERTVKIGNPIGPKRVFIGQLLF